MIESAICCSVKALTETTFPPKFQHIAKNAYWKYGNQKSSSFCTVIQISLLIRQISVGIERATKFHHQIRISAGYFVFTTVFWDEITTI